MTKLCFKTTGKHPVRYSKKSGLKNRVFNGKKFTLQKTGADKTSVQSYLNIVSSKYTDVKLVKTKKGYDIYTRKY